jgi:histidinol-phosphate aminotransferase
MFEITPLIRPNIRNLEAYSSARDEFSGNEGVFLDANENPFGQWNRYPDPYQLKLKEILAERKGLAVNQIFVGNGSDEVIDLLFRIFCEPGKDKALTFSPTYGMYSVSAAINDVELIQIPLNADFDLNLELTLPVLKEENLKLIFICSPNNPTGNSLSIKNIETILASFKGIVLIDEAYIDFSSKSSLIGLLSTYPNLIVSQTMSKARGLAAARIGFAFASEEIIQLMNKVKPPYNVSGLNQQQAIETLLDQNRFDQEVKQLLTERDILIEALKGIQLVKKIYPTDANFVLVEVADANGIYSQLVERKIIVRNRNSVINNCLRITVGSNEENKRLISEIKQIENEKSTIY